MQVNGFKLQLVLKRLTAQRELELSRFGDTLWVFEGDDGKATPDQVAERYLELERKIAKVQVAQTVYNNSITIEPEGFEPMPLQHAVKFIGGLTRLERLWKSTVKPKETPRWARSDDGQKVRDKEKDYARARLNTDELMKRTMDLNKLVSNLRGAIQTGNGTVVDVKDLGLTADDVA